MVAAIDLDQLAIALTPEPWMVEGFKCREISESLIDNGRHLRLGPTEVFSETSIARNRLAESYETGGGAIL